MRLPIAYVLLLMFMIMVGIFLVLQLIPMY